MCRARPWHERSLQDRPGGRVLVPGLQPAMCLASLLDTASSALGPAFMPGGSGSPAPIVQLALASFSMSGLIRSPRMLRASKRRAVRFDPLEARPQAVRDAAIRQSLDSSRPSPLPSPGSAVNWRLPLFIPLLHDDFVPSLVSWSSSRSNRGRSYSGRHFNACDA